MIPITPEITLRKDEIGFEFIRSPGPGGQNVNKTSTGVKLRFNVKDSTSLPGRVKERLIGLAGKRATRAGILIIEAHRFRSQDRNRKDAIARLTTLIKKAAKEPVRRIPTGPSTSAKVKRLEEKLLRSGVKSLRKSVKDDEDS